jgi:hypothetical protein
MLDASVGDEGEVWSTRERALAFDQRAVFS